MKITLFSIGTQGDVRPFVALGLGLQARGHRVCIASGQSCEALVRRFGLDFSPLEADFLEVMAKDPNALQKGLNPVRFVRTARAALKKMSRRWPEQGLAAADGADLLLGNGMVSILAASLGERLHIPVVETHLQPVTPCPDIPPMMVKPPRRPLPGPLNIALYQSLRFLTWQMLGAAYRGVRRDLGLTKLPWYGPYYGRDPNSHRVLYGFSPTLVPPSPFWPRPVKVAGNWFLDEGANWPAPAPLLAFLEQGEKPLYVGFGSMLGGDTRAFSELIAKALLQANKRAIIATGWGGLEPQYFADERFFITDSAPHDWLFPRVSMAIHHGGAGTTAAGLRAGIPAVVVPFFGDQPFWAWRLKQLGVAGSAVTRKHLTIETLLAQIAFASEPGVQQKAAALGQKIRQENGVDEAISQLTAWGLLSEGGAETAR